MINTMGTIVNVYLTGRDDFRSIEIVDKRVNKKLAIDRLINLCGFTDDEVAVFGDDFNDMEMLKGFQILLLWEMRLMKLNPVPKSKVDKALKI